MGTVVCVWEMGANLGHLGNLKHIAQQALRRGHKVWLLARDLSQVHTVFGGLAVNVLQAPTQKKSPVAKIEEIQCFSQLIRNSGYRSREDLLSYLIAWQSLFDLISPDLVFYDHSPLALAASWDYSFRKVIVGNGFTLPPMQTRLLGVFPEMEGIQQNSEQLVQSEYDLLSDLQSCFAQMNCRPLERVTDVYHQANEVVRFTIPEFDHFFVRPTGPYVGVWPAFGEAAPLWKNQRLYKAFAYLKKFEGLSLLLKQLRDADVEVVLFCPDLTKEEVVRLTAASIIYAEKPLDLSLVASTADFAITHGNHDTTVQLALLGLPMMIVPRHQEQFFLAKKYQELTLGELAFHDQTDFSGNISSIINRPEYRHQSRQLSEKYRHAEALDPVAAIEGVLDRAFQ